MERLTKRDTSVYGGVEYVLCKHTDEECNDWCMHKKCKWIENALKKLKAYEDAEEQGLLLRLPAPIGKKVYVVVGCLAPNCDLCKAFEWHRGCYPEYRGKIIEREMRYGDIPKFGKTVFLTRTEAEQALAEMEKEKLK